MLKRIRVELDLTQAQMAEKAEISQSFYSQIEKGTKKPSVSTMEKIARAANKPVAEIFFATDCCLKQQEAI